MTEQEKREKVIKGLMCIAGDVVFCAHCKYSDVNGSGRGDRCKRDCAKDALALLKAQEPRVLALEEIHRGMAVWLEDVDKADVILAIGGASAGGVKCFITEKDMSITPKDAEYDIRWRAWTQKPIDAQRKAVEWDGTD